MQTAFFTPNFASTRGRMAVRELSAAYRLHAPWVSACGNIAYHCLGIWTVEMTAHLECFVGSRFPALIVGAHSFSGASCQRTSRRVCCCRKLVFANHMACRQSWKLSPHLSPARCRCCVFLDAMTIMLCGRCGESVTLASGRGKRKLEEVLLTFWYRQLPLSTAILHYPGATWNLWSQNKMIDRATRLPQAPQGERRGLGCGRQPVKEFFSLLDGPRASRRPWATQRNDVRLAAPPIGRYILW